MTEKQAMFKFKVNGEDEIEAVTQRCSINKVSEKFHKIHSKIPVLKISQNSQKTHRHWSPFF